MCVYYSLSCTKRSHTSRRSMHTYWPSRSETSVLWQHAALASPPASSTYSSLFQGTSGTIFASFACLDLDDGSSYLNADMSVECSSDYHQVRRGVTREGVVVHGVSTFGRGHGGEEWANVPVFMSCPDLTSSALC